MIPQSRFIVLRRSSAYAPETVWGIFDTEIKSFLPNEYISMQAAHNECRNLNEQNQRGIEFMKQQKKGMDQ